MRLYHFTADRLLLGCRADGLTKGVIPFEPSRGSRIGLAGGFQWLTANPGWDAQRWATAVAVGYSRTDYRITVRIPRSQHPNLVPWLAICPDTDMTRYMNAAGGAEDWWIFHGRVKPGWFREIDRNPNINRSEPSVEVER